MADDQMPEAVSADYENTPVREALTALQTTPDHAHLADFLLALREGHLVADATGTMQKKRGKGIRVRTIRSTDGRLVLPLFTSMDRLRATVTDKPSDQIKGVVMPAKDALGLITTDRFVAAEIDKGADWGLVVLRKYISLAAGDAPITATTLQGMR